MQGYDSVPALGCVANRKLFQHALLEEPPTSGAPREVREEYEALRQRAEAICSTCPLQEDCRYDAVVRFDVAGFVGGTTERDRERVRRRLGVSVAPEDLDRLAGVPGSGRLVDHDEVVRLRSAYPTDSLAALADRLGCSLSTVKRHLRQERAGAVRAVVPPRPSKAEVQAAFAAVSGRTPHPRTVAA